MKNKESSPNYWGFRTHWRNPEAHKFICSELHKNRLRQGWGWLEEQKLPECKEDQGAKRNLPIYKKVKKGDYLLIPHVPSYSMVTIVRAKEDFDTGYKYEIAVQKSTEKSKGFSDYGHIFPVEIVKEFDLHNNNVNSCIQKSFKNRGRFWRMWECDASIDRLVKSKQEDLISITSYETKVEKTLDDVAATIWDQDKLKESLQLEFTKAFQASGWEYALVHIFRKLLPYYTIERIGGQSEKQHGCDIKIGIPGIEKDKSYVIGIQVKDYKDVVGYAPIEQILKADDYWKDNNNEKLIDKYVILIGAKKELNETFKIKAEESDVSVLYEDGVADLLMRAVKYHLVHAEF